MSSVHGGAPVTVEHFVFSGELDVVELIGRMARNDPETWASWHEESFRLDVDSPLAISRSLWDELSQNEADSRTLFSTTPATDVTETGTIFSHQDLAQIQYDLEQDSPRKKRRRVLVFSQGGYEISEGQDLVPDRQDVVENPAWYNLDTGMRTCNGGLTNLEETDAADEQQPDWWMETCFNDDEDQNMQMTCRKNLQVPLCQTASESTECMQEEFARAPVTPVSVTPPATLGRKKNRVLQKVSSPVAYPFALVKPCGASGDVTLSDLNQRLRARPMRRLSGELNDSAQVAGLSGKSVVALTKIHTEGNGSITIMRTRG